jgi:AcrR family transcriptional regulator
MLMGWDKMVEKKIKKRKQQAIDTRQRIFDAAISLIFEKGFENVQIEDISHKAEISMGLFYRYFSKKEDIITEDLFNTYDNCYQEFYNEHLANIKGIEKLMAFVSHLAKLHETKIGKNMLRYHYTNIISRPNHGNKVICEDRFIYLLIGEAITEAQQSGELQRELDVSKVAREIVIILRGIIFEYLLYKDDDTYFDLVKNEQDMISTYLKGYS